MRNLQEMFSVRRLSDEDIMRMYWWTRGIRRAFGTIVEPPESSIMMSELDDGYAMGLSMKIALARMKPK